MRICNSTALIYRIARIVLIAFVYSLNLFAQWNNNNGIKTNILSSNSNSTVIEYILMDYDEEFLFIDGTKHVFYKIPGSIWLMERGMPQLPTDRQSIIIPDLAATNFSILETSFEIIETLPVMPSKGHFTRNIDPDSVPFVFDDFYSENRWYPEHNISLDVPYVVRDLRGQTIQFYPMQYNPAESKIKICRRIVLEVYTDPNGIIINPFERVKPFEGITKEFNDIYRTLFMNYGYGNYDYTTLEETGRLLIIYASDYASNVTPFYNWKVERGLPTLLAEYPAQTGSGSAAIKTYIQNLYDSPDGLTFIVLVGESNQVPTLYGQYEGAPSDPCYVKLAGNDAYPDAFISRLSPSSTGNLDYVLWKMIRYEKFPDTGPNADWYLKGTGVASDEGDPPDWQRANWLRDMLMNNMYFTEVDQIYDPGATSAQVTNALNDGRSVLNYLGHGSGTSWSTTGFSVSNIHQLNNGYKNPFIIDVACTNGDFTISECMEEAWIRAGDLQDPKGAISAYGASTLASWVPPCDMQNHAIELLTTREKQTVGGICFNGLMYAMDLWGGSTGEGLKLMEQYNIMGDCSMIMTFGMEQDTIPPGQITDLVVSDPTSNSVTLNWTSPLDSSFLGVVSYDLRYSLTPIVTNSDFENAPQVIVPGGPDTAGISKSYLLEELEFSTLYYFAIKALDIWGNKSEMSNVTSESTWGAPEISVTPDSMHCILLPNIIYTDSIMISNESAGNSTLDYEIELANNTFPGNVLARIVEVNLSGLNNYSKEQPDLSKGTSLRGSGGPDLFGYTWIDSNDPDGPEFIWNDISATGTLVTNWEATGIYPAVDEGKAGPFQLGFLFKYYGVEYGNIWLCSNGFVSFLDITDAGMSNDPIPTADEPNCIVAGIWDDLDGKTTGKVYYKQEADKFIVQYDNWPGYYSGTGPFTFQYVLHKNGKILVYYKTISGTSTSATVGIENHEGNDGLQVVRNSVYLENELALQFSADPEWLLLESFEGTIYNGNSVAVMMNFITEGLESGEYTMDVIVRSNDPNNSELTVPVRMTVTNQIPVEFISFTAENNLDEVTLSWETASETNNNGFEVQRSQMSNVKGQSEWKSISFIEGKGTTTERTNYSFKDQISETGIYFYRLKQIDFDGTFSYSSEIEIEVSGPTEFALYQNYPNPFNPSTTIKFALPERTDLELSVYNSLGEKVADVFKGELGEGYHEIVFNINAGNSGNVRNLSSGIYFYRLESKDFVSVKKMIVIK